MNQEALELVVKYVHPDDYESVTLVSRDFHKAMKTVQAPVMLHRCIREAPRIDFAKDRGWFTEAMKLFVRALDSTPEKARSEYKWKYINKLMTDLRFDGLITE